MRPKNWKQETPVLAYTIPKPSVIRKNIEAAGLTYKDGLGRDIDFHALRYTWATYLARNGVPTRKLQALCRHSDANLSANIYTDASQLDTFAAISDLPELFSGCVDTPLSTPKTDFYSHGPSLNGTKKPDHSDPEVVLFESFKRFLAATGTDGHGTPKWWEILELNQ